MATAGEVFAAAERFGLEGIVSKRAGSRYRAGRSKVWLKTKCMTEGEFVVVGMAANPGAAPVALLARETKEGLVYAGAAMVTLPQPARDAFWRTTEQMKGKPRPAGAAADEGKLRHARAARPRQVPAGGRHAAPRDVAAGSRLRR